MAEHAINPGEAFQPGEVWQTGRGLLWRVMRVEQLPGRSREAVLKLGQDGTGRSVRRAWDAVSGWTLETPASARAVMSALQCERFRPLLDAVQPGGAVIAQISGNTMHVRCVTPAQAEAIKSILDGVQADIGEQQP